MYFMELFRYYRSIKRKGAADLSVKERILTLELLERIRRYPKAAADVGVEGRLRKAPETRSPAKTSSEK